MTTLAPSNRAVNRAGDFLRDALGSSSIDAVKWRESWQILNWYRRRWSESPQPLAKVDMGLRSMAFRATNGAAKVSQRLKRSDRIVDKLRRLPKMNLAQLQDIGGCRAVVPTLEELQTLRARIMKVWAKDIDDVDDLLAKPRGTGYRAVHVIVKRDGRLVEVQLRTLRQHRWATSYEYMEQRTRELDRDADPDEPTAKAFSDLGLAFDLLDRHEPVETELIDRLKGWLSTFDQNA